MVLLCLGVLLWIAAHLFKRLAPAAREGLGAKGKGLVALVILVSLGMMILGYRSADGAVFWGSSPATRGINNLLVLVGLFMTTPAPKRGRLLAGVRHPMLIGVLLWAVAHLLVNGDVPSFVLFGGLALWTLLEMAVINRAEPEWSPRAPGSYAKDAMFLVASLVVMAIIGGIHMWFGYQVFG